MAARLRPEAASISSQDVLRTLASNSSKPCVCCSMKATSSTRLPSALASSSAAKTCLQMPEHDRDITAGLDLMILAADPGLLAGQHLAPGFAD